MSEVRVTSLHSKLIRESLGRILRKKYDGAMAFLRCLSPEVVLQLFNDGSFTVKDWRVFRVADANPRNLSRATITADQAVEYREDKGSPMLLVVDTARAGAGMDGIYSAATEVVEVDLFSDLHRTALNKINHSHGKEAKEFARQSVVKARTAGNPVGVSAWTEFDFYVSILNSGGAPGAHLWKLGFWPVAAAEDSLSGSALDISKLFFNQLLSPEVASRPPGERIAALRLLDPSSEQVTELTQFLSAAATSPLPQSLETLAGKPQLWVNALRLQSGFDQIKSLEMVSWWGRQGKLVAWSGLVEEDDESAPAFILDPKAAETGNYSKLEVRWKVQPSTLEKGAVHYRVCVTTGLKDELAVREIVHTGRKEEKCAFTNDDFTELNESSAIIAKVTVSVVGNNDVAGIETEEFCIQFGNVAVKVAGSGGKEVRCLAEGLIELDDRVDWQNAAGGSITYKEDARSHIVLRDSSCGKSFRVFYPPLMKQVEQDWCGREGATGRWVVKVRGSGAVASGPHFVPIDGADDRVISAARRFAGRFSDCVGGPGQVFDQDTKSFDVVKEYLLAWSNLLESAAPELTLTQTIEVQSLSGRTMGLIVLPSHPLRVAWHAGYDNLVFFSRYTRQMPARFIRDELRLLDGAMFPAFLPGLQAGQTFVYGDSLGFHAVAMVRSDDREPKAAVAVMARLLGSSEVSDSTPTVGRQSAEVVGQEITKYVDCHVPVDLLHVHALRPGDGLTIARSLGNVLRELNGRVSKDEDGETSEAGGPSFVLELFPSEEQRGIAGRFLAEARERRRSGAGVVADEDQWMLESMSRPGGVNIPRLRWARKRDLQPESAAHVAVAFDTFDSRVEALPTAAASRPLFGWGLISFLERSYQGTPSPIWRSYAAVGELGATHPAGKTHTERLIRLQKLIAAAVVRNLGAVGMQPVLTTEVSPEQRSALQNLHRLCDWVITLDRNAGIEFFDSPRDNPEIYEAYVIDCVPEREDLGCLQLITSTSNLDEVRSLLDSALDRMGLSRSRRNAEYLLTHLKSLSGRLAIRLTGQHPPTSELIALAMSHAQCSQAQDDRCWTPLQSGFFVPLDDVQDLLPVGNGSGDKAGLDEQEPSGGGRAVRRADLLYVSLISRRGLLIRFVEIKYRRYLRNARHPETMETIRQQTERLRRQWSECYSGQSLSPEFRALRRARLARVLRFYADKARRHADDESSAGLNPQVYKSLVEEIDRLVVAGADYEFADVARADRGWIFCPEFAGAQPQDVTPQGWPTQIFLFGPESQFQQAVEAVEAADTQPLPSVEVLPAAAKAAISDEHADQRILVAESADAGAVAECDPVAAAVSSGPAKTVGTVAVPAVAATTALCVGVDPQTTSDVLWPVTVKGNPHLMIAGLPGMGKTTLLLNLCRQMLQRGICPIVFSYHEDIDAKLSEAVGGLRFVDFDGLGFNPLQVLDRSNRMAYLDVAGSIRDIFMAIFPELGDIQGERIRQAIKDSFVELGWGSATDDVTQLAEPRFDRWVQILRAAPKLDKGLQTLLARLSELEDYGFFRPAVTPLSLWDSSAPVVVRIHGTQNEHLQKAFSSLIFYGLYKDMFRRGLQDRITHAVVFDEAHRAARLQLIPTMAKECRKYGISLVLASQEAKDFHSSLFSAVANYLILRLTDADARALARNVTSSDQEKLFADRIKQLPRFRAFYCSESQKRPLSVSLKE
jgi:DNA phosphorothioation-dependent restriction protein DptH